ncbi:exodeoxyribonuclease V, beta subunit [Leptothrix cholodnii SP-6]|uniref:RecBCD enzyme subunit RecB n=1 Tax=Leptothrix cholodnii (strain ATCC 51168 / LMG 8142 / SP-6) TaxID=395495 RepID=B1XZ25_LEPCP|nr:exodeoxyribonuclease V subunit beta [Leptothrix cholodnii]ACB34044.1 exodeoxyribonuclease V, beta subunit [Leptothrix cholodnii SP-6]
MTPLNPLTLPLHGSHLIEASAGTGKTWTIAALYLRLVLGHGERESVDSPLPRPLLPAEILVMTFTRAATRELSDRIRERLIEAARCFRGEAEPAPHDHFLRDLRADYPGEAERRDAAYRLALAAEGMDDAAVHTIDAWCQRMLREHAFDSAQLFDEELEADEAGRRRQAVQDYWRREVYPLRGAALETVLSLWPEVAELQSQVAGLLGKLDLLEGVPEGLGLRDWLGQIAAQRSQELAQLKAGWVERADFMQGWINQHRTCKPPVLAGARLKSNNVSDWFDALRAWAADPALETLDMGKTAPTRLTPEGIAECFNDGCAVPVPADFAAFAQLMFALGQRAPLHEPLQRHAAFGVARRLAALKRQAGRFGYADLVERLDAALHGPAGERLAQRIRTQYPLALIDEFQDTSPLQYRLFDRLYDVAANRADTGLLLIGDPKQSIYGFRGADIYSYLKAREATAERRYMLTTNFRSTAALVAAVNTLFEQAEAARPEGAFALGKDESRALPFDPVAARGRGEVLVAGGAALPALQLAWLPGAGQAQVQRRELADHAAAQLVAWLADPTCGWSEGDAPLRRLRPSDVAVLVRDQHEAAAIRRALQRRGVHSVYLSDKDSVYASAEAADLLRWLMAVAQPLDGLLARAAYANASWDLGLDELAAHVHDETAWDARLALLQQLHGVWQRQGVLTMLRQTLHALDLPARWLAEGNEAAGERRLTNVLHLGELLQAASAHLEGEAGLIRWLAAMVRGGGDGAQGGSGMGGSAAAAGAGGDAHIVRLESDAQLVQVVTVHKSKGLEYPVVMLPFANSARAWRKKRHGALEWVDDDGRRALDFAQQPEHVAAAERERLREDLRLFYVALTRARHALWLGIGVPPTGRNGSAGPLSALGYLLAGDQGLREDSLGSVLQALCDVSDPPATRSVCLDVPAQRVRWRDDRAQPPLHLPPVFQAEFERRWAIGSFSGLVRDLGERGAGAGVPATPHGATDLLRTEQLQEELAQMAQLTQMAAQADGQPAAPSGSRAAAIAGSVPTWHGFPRGALPGNFLHDQLQWLAEEGFERAGESGVAAALLRRCERAGHAQHAAGAVDWLQQLLATPLPPLGASLAEVDRLLPEMEFWMPSVALRSAELDRICQQHLLPGQPRPALVSRQLDGLLMGFADLVFEHGGRWWVLDYKSNALGATDADYTPAALSQAMLAHRYELQAAIYLLALHRLLRSRLGDDYDPARQLGGALYLFLRGFKGPAAGCVHLSAEPAWLDALDAALSADPCAVESQR